MIGLNQIGLHHIEVATLPSKRWPTYPLRGITLFTLYNNNEYYLGTKINCLYTLLKLNSS